MSTGISTDISTALIVWLCFAVLNAAAAGLAICIDGFDNDAYEGQAGARKLLKRLALLPLASLAGPLLWLWLAERSFSRLLNRAYPDGFGFWKRTEQRRSLLERGQDLMAEMQEYEERKRQQKHRESE